MSSYPKQLRLFKAWAKAMEAGASVGNPSYSTKTSKPRKQRNSRKRWKKRFLRKKRKKHAD